MDSLATVGRVSSDIGLIFAIFLGIVLFIISIYLFFAKQQKLQSVIGTVKKVNSCNVSPINCNITVSYIIDGKTYEHDFNIPSANYLVGSTIPLYYNPSNISQISTLNVSDTKMASIFCCISIVILLIAFGKYYLTHRYRSYAVYSAL